MKAGVTCCVLDLFDLRLEEDLHSLDLFTFRYGGGSPIRVVIGTSPPTKCSRIELLRPTRALQERPHKGQIRLLKNEGAAKKSS